MTIEWRIVLAAFTTYRLAWSLAVEDGPRDLLFTLRARLGAYDYADEPGPRGEPVAVTALGRFASCLYCQAIVAAVPLTCLVLIPLNGWLSWIRDALLIWGGVVGATMALIRLTRLDLIK